MLIKDNMLQASTFPDNKSNKKYWQKFDDFPMIQVPQDQL